LNLACPDYSGFQDLIIRKAASEKRLPFLLPKFPIADVSFQFIRKILSLEPAKDYT